MTQQEKIAMLIVALENAIGVIEADDALLELFDPKHSGMPSCVDEWRRLVADCRG